MAITKFTREWNSNMLSVTKWNLGEFITHFWAPAVGSEEVRGGRGSLHIISPLAVSLSICLSFSVITQQFFLIWCINLEDLYCKKVMLGPNLGWCRIPELDATLPIFKKKVPSFWILLILPCILDCLLDEHCLFGKLVFVHIEAKSAQKSLHFQNESVKNSWFFMQSLYQGKFFLLSRVPKNLLTNQNAEFLKWQYLANKLRCEVEFSHVFRHTSNISTQSFQVDVVSDFWVCPR